MSELEDQKAIEEIAYWMQGDLHRSWLLTIESLIQKNLKNYSSSVLAAEKAISINKNNAWARLVGSHAALMLNDIEKAIRLSTSGLAIAPDHPGLIEIAVGANLVAGRTEEVAGLFSKLQTLHPERSRQLKERLEKAGIRF